MVIGTPREIKESEYRVAMVPAGVEQLSRHGHALLIEAGAGLGTSISDDAYCRAGAEIVASPEEIYSRSDMVVKVKEPQPRECGLIREGQIVFTYFHFAASQDLTHAMLETRATCIAYETIQTPNGSLPLLIPMSEVAGRMAVQEGAKYLEKPMEGRGILLAGVPGVAPANVVVLGGGIVGANAAKIAAGFGANVTIMDVNLDRLRYLDDVMPKNVTTIFSDAYTVREKLRDVDLLIGAVLVRGTKAPVLVTREMLKLMKPGAVIVDVAVDQGGCFETTRPTTHKNPTFIVDGIVHYCVANMPGAVAGTSTFALTNETLPYVKIIADKGFGRQLLHNHSIRSGLNIHAGKVYLEAIATQYGLPLASSNDIA